MRQVKVAAADEAACPTHAVAPAREQLPHLRWKHWRGGGDSGWTRGRSGSVAEIDREIDRVDGCAGVPLGMPLGRQVERHHVRWLEGEGEAAAQSGRVSPVGAIELEDRGRLAVELGLGLEALYGHARAGCEEARRWFDEWPLHQRGSGVVPVGACHATRCQAVAGDDGCIRMEREEEANRGLVPTARSCAKGRGA